MMSTNSHSIAIVGIGCRFPGNATDPEKLWDLLAEGRNCWTPVPSDRFNESAFYCSNSEASGTHNHRGGHFLNEDVAAFDADFFRISPGEAEAIDPQQRMLLEVTYEALESSGIALDDVQGSNTAVYVASFSHDYDRILSRAPEDIPKYHTTGTGEAILANRISYTFDLRGASMTLDTGCSGSMVAVHQACQALRTGEADMAIAGGVNLILGPDQMIGMANMHMLNNDGRSYSFDGRGSGYGRGEGISAVVLKRLDDAITGGDPVRAIIRNTGVNQDGRTSGITLPNKDSQANLQRSIYRNVDIECSSIGYMEAHGTGTAAGDFAEIAAIADVMCERRTSPLYVGSIKSNIGHLESSSGLAGLLKAVLVLEKGLIPPNADYGVPKPELKLSERNIRIPAELEEFPQCPIRRVAVNSFGYGGTNAHVLLDQAPDIKNCANQMKTGAQETEAESCKTTSTQQVRPRLFMLSARSKKSLSAQVQSLIQWLSRPDVGDLEGLSYTLSARRTHLDWRFTIVAENLEELIDSLRGMNVFNGLEKSSPRFRVCFMFTGQGAQWYAMGRELIFACHVFRMSLLRSDSILRDLGASWNLIDELLREESESRIDQGCIAQPSCTALQIALVDLLRDVGVHPHTVLGHSSGEIAAAYTAGFLSHASALKVAYHRSFVSASRPNPGALKGAMLAVGLSERDTLGYIAQVHQGDLCIACVNSPSSTTVSGDRGSILQLQALLKNSSISNKMLQVDTAYHSHHMRAASSQYLDDLVGLEVQDPVEAIKFVSSVSASVKESEFGPPYWVQNLVSKVRYADAISTYCDLYGDGTPFGRTTKHVMIEIGPHPALAGPTQQTIRAKAETIDYTYFPSLTRKTSALRSFLSLTGSLFSLGLLVRADKANSLTSSRPSHTVLHDLPPYPWDHTHRYWYESQQSRDYRFRQHAPHDLLGVRIAGSTSLEPRWRHLVGVETLPWIQEHVVDDLVIFPGSGYLCMAIEAVRQLVVDSDEATPLDVELKKVAFRKALVIPPAPEKVEVQICLRGSSQQANSITAKTWEYTISALSSDGVWYEHCHGLVAAARPEPQVHGVTMDSAMGNPLENTAPMSSTSDSPWREFDHHELYRNLQSNGNRYGSYFAGIKKMQQQSNSRLLTEVEIPDVVRAMPAQLQRRHFIHPTTLDAIMHTALPLYTAQKGPASVMPIEIETLEITSHLDNTPLKRFHVQTDLRSVGPASAEANVYAYDPMHKVEPVIRISGLKLRGFAKTTDVASIPEHQNTNFRMEWGVDVDFISRIESPTPSTEAIKGLAARTAILNRVASIYIKRSLDKYKLHNARASQSQVAGLVERLEKSTACQSPQSERSRLCDDFVLGQAQCQGIEGRIVSRVGQSLADILAERINPIEVMLQDGLLDKFYAESVFTQCFAQLAQVIRHICFKFPRIRILEIGARVGSVTLPLLKALGSEEIARLGHYDITDNSAAYLEEAKKLLDEWKSLLSFKVLEVHQDPIQQGFEPESYDVIIAANASQNLLHTKESLANIRKLLKPRGKLIILEVNQMEPFLGMILGMFPGSWQGHQDDLGLDNYHSVDLAQIRQEWQSRLSDSSFSGIDLVMDDLEGPAQSFTLIVSTATVEAPQRLRPSINILGDCSKHQDDSDVISVIQHDLQSQGYMVKCVSWDSDISIDDDYVVIDNKEHLLLPSAPEARFDKLVNLMAHGRRVLWISVTNTSGDDVRNPGTGLVTGLTRTAHAENPGLRMVTLDIQAAFSEEKSELLSIISRLISELFLVDMDHDEPREREYVYKHKKLMIPRLLPHDLMDQNTFQKRDEVTVMRQIYGQKGHPLRLAREQKTDMPNEIYFSQAASLDDPPNDYEVDIDVKAHAINAQSLAFASGHVEGSTPVMGECAGVVAALGSLVLGLHIGDRVCAVGGEPFASRIRVPGRNAARLPDSIPFNVGASVPLAFMTAHYCLSSLVRPGTLQSILLRAAGGATGRATVVIAQRLGFLVAVMASSESERESLIRDLDIPPQCIMLDDPSTLKEKVLEQAGPNGVDALLCLDRQALTEEQVACVAPLGSILQVADANSQDGEQIRTIPRASNLTLRFVDLKSLIPHQYLEASTLLAAVFNSYEQDLIQLEHSIDSRPIGQIADVLKLHERDLHASNVVLETGVDSVVNVTMDKPPVLALESDATYVIAGGLGDLGQRIARMMVTRGARHICALSRRTLTIDEHQKIEHGLQMMSPEARFYCKVCDIAHATEVKQCVAEISSSNMPVIRGVVQAAVAMNDRTLSKIRLDDFNTPLNAKVHGTHNLFHAFENVPLQFFIILSSVSGVFGMSGQASYAAGSVYQDYLANSGLNLASFPCISLDVGLVTGTDADTPTTRENFARHGLVPIQWSEVVVALDYAMGSPHMARDTCKQLIIGVNPQALSRAKIVNATFRSPMFCHIRPHAESSCTDGPTTNKKTLRDALADSADPDELLAIVANAITRKLQSLVSSSSDSFDDNDERIDFSMTVLGLDSLVITELKNWISLEFGAAVHVSEIFERDSVAALAALVISRSAFVQQAGKPALESS